MTIILTPETEARLRQKAERAGKDVNGYADALLADALLADALTDAPDDLTADEIAEVRAGIRRGLEAAAAGRERPLAEYMADVQKRRMARQDAFHA